METLVIPLGIDSAAAKKALDDLGAEGHNSGKKIESGMDVATGAAHEFGSALTGILGLQTGMGMIGQAVGVVTDRMREAAEYTKKVIDDFVTLREVMRGVAALQGKGATTEFTKEQLTLSEHAKILTPTEFAAAQEAFTQFGSEFVSEEGRPGTAQTEQATIDEILPEVMGYAKSQKISPESAAKLLSSIIQKMPKGTSADDYKRIFMKQVQLAKRSRGSAESTVQQLIPVLAANVGAGMAYGEYEEGIMAATRGVAVQQQAHTGQGGEYNRSMLTTFMHLKSKEEEEELGITDEMTPEQKVLQIKEKFKASGKKKFADFWLEITKGQIDIQGMEALQTAINASEKFEDYKDSVKGIKGDDLGTALEKYASEGAGEEEATEARTARAESRRGAEFSGVGAAKGKAKSELTEEVDPSGRNVFQRTEPRDLLRNTVGRALGFGDRDQQLIEQRAREDLEKQVTPEQRDQARYDSAGSVAGHLGVDYTLYLKKLVELAEANHHRPMPAPAPQPQPNRN